ncbi:MAG: flagellar filament capping protein FliD, partial [Algisphaera sp.]
NSTGNTGGVDMTGAETLDDLINRINDADLGVEASITAAGTGIAIEDVAGGLGALEIIDPFTPPDQPLGVLATQLGLAGTYTQGEVDGGPLGFQFFNEGSRLDTLGITRGKFMIQDSDGRSAEVDLTQGNEQTIADVLGEINSRGLAINARINDTGDGILIEDLGGGATDIEIAENGSTTARDLGVLGTFPAGDDINGAFSITIEVTAVDTLKSLATKINDAKVGVDAAVINDGTPGGGFRLNLSSDKAGRGGAFTLDDHGLGLEIQELAKAKDAVVFLGGDDPADSLLVTSESNTLAGLVPGATISLLTTSDAPIQIAIGDDREAVTGAVGDFVSSFNGLIDKINEFDSYNSETKERGLLLGDASVGRVRTAIYNAISGRNAGLTGQFNSLAQVGVKVGKGAKLTVDSEQLLAALEADPDGVRDLFSFEQLVVDPETGEDTEEVIAQGIGREIDKLLERLTDSEGGPLERQSAILQSQLDLNKKRIEAVDRTIEDKKARLEKEFVDLERTLAGLQDQQGALNTLAASQ